MNNLENKHRKQRIELANNLTLAAVTVLQPCAAGGDAGERPVLLRRCADQQRVQVDGLHSDRDAGGNPT